MRLAREAARQSAGDSKIAFRQDHDYSKKEDDGQLV